MLEPTLPPLVEVALRVAERAPAADGLKLTLTVQLWLGCRDGPQLVVTLTKSVALVPPMVMVTGPLSRLMPPALAVFSFVIVKVCAASVGVLGNEPSVCPTAVSTKHAPDT